MYEYETMWMPSYRWQVSPRGALGLLPCLPLQEDQLLFGQKADDKNRVWWHNLHSLRFLFFYLFLLVFENFRQFILFLFTSLLYSSKIYSTILTQLTLCLFLIHQVKAFIAPIHLDVWSSLKGVQGLTCKLSLPLPETAN